ncbi:MAG TPA: (d)CMP kinase [Gemmatimonadales bacterium]|nr:(d)CMP kinase [Gemmatimonadales bacterium]HVK00345.1 (d)CMP kinase [Gemmatimonadales bacterium]
MKGGVVAIDGPAASGKSSTARAVAEALGFAHLDSGSLYRGVTLVGIREAARRGRSGDDPLEIVGAEAILRAAEDRGLMLQPDGAGFAAYLEGEPVDAEIRGAEVTALVSAVSAVPVVREWINSRLRAMVRAGRDVVVDGRDIGTVVFPDAELKIFLTASPEARAGRRLTQRGGAVDAGGVEAETAALAARDAADSTRAVAPLVAAPDAVPLDTTAMTFSDQVRFIVELARPIFGSR